MATVTIRNLDEEVVEKLKARAKARNRSLEGELREILSAAVRGFTGEPRLTKEEFLALAKRIAAMTPDKPQTDSAKLLREDRDR